MTNSDYNSSFSNNEFTDDTIVCQKCYWEWKVKDGGDDLYVCHKCYTDNGKFYIDKEVYSNVVDPNIIIQGVTAVAGVGSEIAKARTSKQMSKSELQKEVDLRCGKDRSKGLRRKKIKQNYNDCKNDVLKEYDIEKQSSAQQQEEQKQLKLKVNQQKNKNKTYLAIGVIALLLGIIIYKKIKK